MFYCGSTAVLRPGDQLDGRGPVVAADPARALANVWREAQESSLFGVPHLYEVRPSLKQPDAVIGSPAGLTVVGDVLINGELAWRALQIIEQG
jgi:hypothetical protein